MRPLSYLFEKEYIVIEEIGLEAEIKKSMEEAMSNKDL